MISKLVNALRATPGGEEQHTAADVVVWRWTGAPCEKLAPVIMRATARIDGLGPFSLHAHRPKGECRWAVDVCIRLESVAECWQGHAVPLDANGEGRCECGETIRRIP